jgi:DNA-binding NarL/FixJ family response regulator
MANINRPTNQKSSIILIADPNEQFCRLLAEQLEVEGFENIHFALTGRDAVGTAAKLKPDLVLLDRSIQEMDSFATLSNLKYLVPDTQVILLVSFVDTSSLTRARELGMDGFYSKSIEPEELARSICKLLSDSNVETESIGEPYTVTRPFIDLKSQTKRLDPREN